MSFCHKKTDIFPGHLVLSIISTIITILFFVTIRPVNSMAGENPYRGKHIAVSLRVLAEKASKSLDGGWPIDKKLINLCSISRLEGYALEKDNNDVILIGRKEGREPSCQLDDLIVNIRNLYGQKAAPYCSLEPQPENVLKMQQLLSEDKTTETLDQRRQVIQRIKTAWGPQMIDIRAIPRNSRLAHIMVDADYHMKKVSLGLDHIPGITSYFEKTLEGVEQNLSTGESPEFATSASRFWFHVKEGAPIFSEAEDIVFLKSCPVVLYAKKQDTTDKGKFYDSDEDDSVASEFAKEFSEQFLAASKDIASYAQLRHMFIMRAVMLAMSFNDAPAGVGMDMGFFLNNYIYQNETLMDETIPGLVTKKEVKVETQKDETPRTYVCIPAIWGGVNMEMKIEKSRFTHDASIKKIRDSVINSRPRENSLTWVFEIN